jgi:NADPH:quinone reductase-like Zn-dependent oxidoreductase
MKNSLAPITEEIAVEKDKTVHNINSLSGLMKAVQVHEYGNAGKLIFETAPIPQPGADEILIKVLGAGVNPVDWKIREGQMKENIRHEFPFIPGCDVAGSVVHTGMLVSRFKKGDLVFAKLDFSGNGCYAEYCVVKSRDVAFAPKNISIYDAAGIPLAAQTAWMGLFEIGELKEHQKVLIQGASGGVCTFAVQLAKIAGAYVIGTTSGKNVDMVKSLGADEVIDYKKEDFSKKLKELNLVFDTIGGDAQDRSWQVLRKGGTLVSTVGANKDMAKKYGMNGKSFMVESSGARLQDIADLVDKKLLKVVLDQAFPLEKAREAQELSQSGKAKGKIILKVQ